jgi:anti-sigma factor RsiW
MDCQLFEKLLPNYLDEELTEELAGQVQAHLIQCGRCAWEVESIRQTLSALQQASASAAPSAEFRKRLLEELLRDHRAATAKRPPQVGRAGRSPEAAPEFVFHLTEEGTYEL